MLHDVKKDKAADQEVEVEGNDSRAVAAIEAQPKINELPAVAQELAGPQAAAADVAPSVSNQPLANHDAMVEQLAHGMVAKDLDDADREFLQVNGYRAMPIIRGKREFVMRTFIPTQPGKEPIVSFRGTVPSKVDTLIADLDPSGIGMYQFNPNRDLITAQMQAASAHGSIISAGHSLGGALAQIAAATFPELVSSIVTFQAPGVQREVAQALINYNEQNPDKAIESSHHRVAGDLVPLGGQVLTPGTVTNHEMTGGNLLNNNALSKHLVFPLAQEELAKGNVLPEQGTQTVTQTGTESTEQANADKTQLVEMARKGLGTLVYGAGGVIIGIKDAVGNVRDAIGNFLHRITH
jgi:hypothetical protein